MKRAIVLVVLLCLLSSALPCCAAQLSPEQQAAADAFFSKLFAQGKTVGGAVIVNQGGERLYGFFYGRASKSGVTVTEDTVYKVASVTKLITAMGVMQLAEQGRLDLDAPLRKKGGEPLCNPAYPDAPLTLRQAMSHTTSLLPSANYTGNPTWTAKYFDVYRPGSRYTYANINGGILGSQIEYVSGQSLNSYMAQHVFAPLHINAAYAAPLLPDPTQLSDSFEPDGRVEATAEAYMRGDAGYDDTCDPDTHFRASVGGLYISLRGMELLGAALANRGRVNGVQVLSPGSVRMMQMDQNRVPGSTVTGESPYGLNTFRVDIAGHTWYGHQGWWAGRLMDLFYEPESSTVLVLAMNGNGRASGTVNREVAAQMERAISFVTPWVEEVLGDMTIIDDEDW